MRTRPCLSACFGAWRSPEAAGRSVRLGVVLSLCRDGGERKGIVRRGGGGRAGYHRTHPPHVLAYARCHTTPPTYRGDAKIINIDGLVLLLAHIEHTGLEGKLNKQSAFSNHTIGYCCPPGLYGNTPV